MNDENKSGFDKIIYESLSKEEQDFLASLDEEPKFTDQAYGLLKGRFRAINWIQTILLYLGMIVLIYAIIRFFKVAPDIEGMLKWGGLSVFCLIGASLGKVWFFMHFQTNRVLREMKKLELQIASMKKEQS